MAAAQQQSAEVRLVACSCAIGRMIPPSGSKAKRKQAKRKQGERKQARRSKQAVRGPNETGIGAGKEEKKDMSEIGDWTMDGFRSSPAAGQHLSLPPCWHLMLIARLRMLLDCGC